MRGSGCFVQTLNGMSMLPRHFGGEISCAQRLAPRESRHLRNCIVHAALRTTSTTACRVASSSGPTRKAGRKPCARRARCVQALPRIGPCVQRQPASRGTDARGCGRVAATGQRASMGSERWHVSKESGGSLRLAPREFARRQPKRAGEFSPRAVVYAERMMAGTRRFVIVRPAAGSVGHQ